jgi:hypothetical protein
MVKNADHLISISFSLEFGFRGNEMYLKDLAIQPNNELRNNVQSELDRKDFYFDEIKLSQAFTIFLQFGWTNLF